MAARHEIGRRKALLVTEGETFAKRRLRTHKHFSTPQRLAAAAKAKRSLKFSVLNAFAALLRRRGT